MAEIIKELKTRVALRTGDYAYWTTGAGKDISLYKGEVCICTVAATDNQATNAPTVLFKVADANGKKFADLNWVSGLAADVYAWAKATEVEHINWLKTNHADTDTQYFFSTDGDKLVVKKAVYTNGIKGTEEAVGTYEFLTETEVRTILGNYYTKTEADGRFAPIGIDTGVHQVDLETGTNNGTVKLTVDGVAKDNIAVKGLGSAAYTDSSAYAPADIDTGVHSVALTGGTNNGTVKLTVDGTSVDNIAVTGLKDAAYTEVSAINATAKGYADAVLGQSTDGAAANTVYGAKAAAAAAQGTANEAKTKIDTFLGTITPDGSQDIIDTLTEINNYVGEHGEEFAALSEKVTKIENGTTVVPKASDADTLDGKQAADFADATENGAKALAQGVKDVVDANKTTWDKAGTAVQTIESGENIGAIRVDGKDVYVSGLEDLAFEKTVTTGLITDKAVTKGKLEQSVQDSLGLADTSLQGFVETGKPEGAASKFITRVEKDGTNIKVVYSDELLAEGGLIRLNTNNPEGMQIQSYNTLSLGGSTVDIRGNIVSYGSSFKFNDKDVLTEVQAGTGLKVAEGTSNKIEIDDEVIFVLNANF